MYTKVCHSTRDRVSNLSVPSERFRRTLLPYRILSDMPTVILATAGYDHTIRLWEARNGFCYRTLQFNESVRSHSRSFSLKLAYLCL